MKGTEVKMNTANRPCHVESSHVASLLKQAQEKVPELEQVLSQRYPELKKVVGNRISNNLRILEYELERFLKFVTSIIQHHEQPGDQAIILGSPNQSPPGWVLQK